MCPQFPSARCCRALAASLVLTTLSQPAGALPVNSQGIWMDAQTRTCSNSTFCTMTFFPVPTGKTLIARFIGCRLSAPTAADRIFIGGNGFVTYLVTGTRNTVGSLNQYVTNTEILLTFTASQKPSVTAILTASATSISFACTLSGDLKP